LFTSRELGFKKPDPAFYGEISRRMNLQPEQCIAMGNNYEKDIVPAKSVGMYTVWLLTHSNFTPVPCADYSIDSMDKLGLVIKALRG
jgi:putative hydrolase of the HAD superfamily